MFIIQNRKYILVAVSAFFAFCAISCTNSKQEGDVAVAEQQQTTTDNNAATATVMVPSFSIKDVNDNIINMQSLKGKKIFVNLWASWCPPCKREMPSIEKLYQSVDSNKVKFLLISFDDQFELAKKYVSSKKLKLPIYYPTENPPALFNVQGIPATFIFNEKGELIKQIEGMENYDTNEYKTLFQ
ncbi:MAG: TlpA family protein disulfide reductase [Flavisolibacter sp.]|nr:TlpA family protein disulfide reductase [Flavisolibacter sp.]